MQRMIVGQLPVGYHGERRHHDVGAREMRPQLLMVGIGNLYTELGGKPVELWIRRRE